MTSQTLEYAQVPIDSAAVYLAGAEVTRHAELTFDAPGLHTVKIFLPGTDACLSTVRATFTAGTCEGSIVKLDSGVDEWTACNRLDRYPEAKPIYQEFLDLCKKNQELRGESTGLTLAMSNVEKVLKYLCSEKCPVAVTDFATHCKLMREARTEVHQLAQKLQEVHRLLKVSQSDIIACGSRLNQALKMGFCIDPSYPPVAWIRTLNHQLLQSNPVDNRTWVQLNIQVDTPGTTTLKLSYLAGNATWHPSYDFRIASGQDEQLDLTYFAYISQNTGEDWKNVSVSLHAGNPSSKLTPPTFHIPFLNSCWWSPAFTSASGAHSRAWRTEAPDGYAHHGSWKEYDEIQSSGSS